MGDRLATINMGRKVGTAVPLSMGREGDGMEGKERIGKEMEGAKGNKGERKERKGR